MFVIVALLAGCLWQLDEQQPLQQFIRTMNLKQIKLEAV